MEDTRVTQRARVVAGREYRPSDNKWFQYWCCGNCKEMTTLIDSFRAPLCPIGTHTRPFDEETLTWPCCGGGRREPGCKPACHIRERGMVAFVPEKDQYELLPTWYDANAALFDRSIVWIVKADGIRRVYRFRPGDFPWRFSGKV